jgi:hypothetical protein
MIMKNLVDSAEQLARGMLLPPRLKHFLGEVYFQFVLRRTSHQVATLAEGQGLDRKTLDAMRRAWRNPLYTATLDYLEELSRLTASAEGAVLECGSGLSTLLLGLLTQSRGLRVWSLEHLPRWHDRVASSLQKCRIENVELCLAPLRNYEAYSWYAPPLERMPKDFRLVVCDGPPGTTPGGRYGLLPIMGEHLAPDCVILFDDAARQGEAQVLRRWRDEFGVRVTLIDAERGLAAVTLS